MRKFFKKWSKRCVLVLLLLVFVCVIFIKFTPHGKTVFHTALFVSEVMDFPVQPQPWFTGEPIREEVSYSLERGAGIADIYRLPDGTPRAAVLLFLGANAAGRDDKAVVLLGQALARAGFVVMFHWSSTMALEYNIDPNEIENLVWAFENLKNRDFVNQELVGMGGFCVGASFALVAAADPRITKDVAFVNAFGPYFDARELLLQTASGSRYYKGTVEPWTPDSLTQRVFVNELIQAMHEPEDRALLTQVFLGGEQLSKQEINQFSEQGKASFALLSGVESMEEAEQLYVKLPEEFQSLLSTISPRFFVARLSSQVLILHDRNDELIPSVESRRLFDDLKESGSNVRYTELLTFDHVRPTSGGAIKDILVEGYKLFRHMYSIIRIAH